MPEVNGVQRHKRFLDDCAAATLHRKRPKLDQRPYSAQHTEHYLDSLPKIWLTRGALKILDARSRRSTTVANCLAQPSNRRPFTRSLHKELLSRTSSPSVSDFHSLKQRDPKLSKRLKRFATRGGPDLADLRGFLEPLRVAPGLIMDLSHRQKRLKPNTVNKQMDTTVTNPSSWRTGKTSGSYDPNFELRLIDSGIFPKNYIFPNGQQPPKPHNFQEIQKVLVRRRASLSLATDSQERFDAFVRADDQATNENKAVVKIIPLLQGTIRDERCIGADVLFNNLADLMEGKSHKAKPDLYYGARPERLNPQLREELSDYVVPSNTTSRPCAPNFFLEIKPPGGSAQIALNQACFFGAVGARGLHTLQTYNANDVIYNNKAYTISAIYHSGQLKLYCHHLERSDGKGSKIRYYMNQINGWSMTGNKDSFVEGLTAFRNAVEWTEEQRDLAIDHSMAEWSARQVDDSQDDGVIAVAQEEHGVQ